MIAWLTPAALAGALLLAGPLVVHLLLRRNARRVRFPATQFLAPSPASATRVRRISDPHLLLLRLGILSASVLAAAQPVVVTQWRVSPWNNRIARAVILDTRGGVPPDAAALAQQEQAQAFRSARFAGEALPDLVARAGEWLEAAPPARRELVMISPFQRGAVDAGAFASLRAGTGIRLIRAGTPPARRDVTLDPVFGWRGASWQPSVALDAQSTRVTWLRTGAAGSISWLSTAQAPEDAESAARAVGAAVASGVPRGDDRRRVLVSFAGAPASPGGDRTIHAPWIAQAALALRDSPLLQDARLRVEAGEHDGRMEVTVPVRPSSLAAPAAVRGVVLAVRPAALLRSDADVGSVTDAELAAWHREAGPVSADPAMVKLMDGSDARWLWALALGLLVVESRVRRSSTAAASHRAAHLDAA